MKNHDGLGIICSYVFQINIQTFLCYFTWIFGQKEKKMSTTIFSEYVIAQRILEK